MGNLQKISFTHDSYMIISQRQRSQPWRFELLDKLRTTVRQTAAFFCWLSVNPKTCFRKRGTERRAVSFCCCPSAVFEHMGCSTPAFRSRHHQDCCKFYRLKDVIFWHHLSIYVNIMSSFVALTRRKQNSPCPLCFSSSLFLRPWCCDVLRCLVALWFYQAWYSNPLTWIRTFSW